MIQRRTSCREVTASLLSLEPIGFLLDYRNINKNCYNNAVFLWRKYFTYMLICDQGEKHLFTTYIPGWEVLNMPLFALYTDEISPPPCLPNKYDATAC